MQCTNGKFETLKVRAYPRNTNNVQNPSFILCDSRVIMALKIILKNISYETNY